MAFSKRLFVKNNIVWDIAVLWKQVAFPINMTDDFNWLFIRVRTNKYNFRIVYDNDVSRLVSIINIILKVLEMKLNYRDILFHRFLLKITKILCRLPFKVLKIGLTLSKRCWGCGQPFLWKKNTRSAWEINNIFPRRWLGCKIPLWSDTTWSIVITCQK